MKKNYKTTYKSGSKAQIYKASRHNSDNSSKNQSEIYKNTPHDKNLEEPIEAIIKHISGESFDKNGKFIIKDNAELNKSIDALIFTALKNMRER